ncbi:MAG: MFS transporter [Pseudomonadota bacterium]
MISGVLWREVLRSWPLFLGVLLLMIGNGLLVTLLTVRAAEQGFSETAIGIMQSCYPLGALLGCLVAPRIVATVGHVRSFGALASLCSTAALVHLVTSDPYSWSAMRLLCGFCFPGLYVVAESWLNGQARNDTRAALLSVYFVTQTGGIMIGQLLLGLPDSQGSLLFVIVSILISLSLVPMLLSTRGEQSFEVPERVRLAVLFRLSSFGFVGSFLAGVTQGMLYVTLGLYGLALGLPDSSVGLLVAATAIGGTLAQFPIGALSDRVDRRLMIALLSTGGLAICLALAAMGEALGGGFLLFAAIGLAGALLLPVYSLCVAHTNDYLQPSQMVAASGALVLVMNAGVVFGPLLGAGAIAALGPGGLFIALAVLQGLTALLAAQRLLFGRGRPEEPSVAQPLSYSATGQAARLYPEMEERKEPNSRMSSDRSTASSSTPSS